MLPGQVNKRRHMCRKAFSSMCLFFMAAIGTLSLEQTEEHIGRYFRNRVFFHEAFWVDDIGVRDAPGVKRPKFIQRCGRIVL